jgi:hypothetical protein
MPRRLGHREGTCKTCLHVERTRIDYLIATGAPLKPLASRFGLKPSSLYNHAKKHISAEYRAAVRIGPFESEERLRQLCAENGVSVVETLRSVNAGVSARWLIAFEAGADDVFVSLTGQFRKNLELMAKLTKELVPPGPTTVVTNNISFFANPEALAAINALAIALRPYPEARLAAAAALRQFTEAGRSPLLEVQPSEAA